MGLSTSVSLENIDRGNDRYKHYYLSMQLLVFWRDRFTPTPVGS
jgi:hypothetical protein